MGFVSSFNGYSDFNIIETGKNYTFPIHRDHINKLLSGVIYIKPEQSSGTIIYENKKGNPQTKVIVNGKEQKTLYA